LNWFDVMPGHRTGCAGHARLEEFNRKKNVDGRDIEREDALRALARP
jgi:hypothetical protein